MDDVASPGTEDGFYIDFFKMLSYFYGYIVGLESASGPCSDQPCRWHVIKGDEFNKTVPAPPAPASPAPAAGKNGALHCPVRVPKLAPAILPPAMAPCCTLQLLSPGSCRR